MSVCSYEPTYSHQFHNYVRLFLIVISFSCHCSCSHQFPGVIPFLLSPVPHDMSLKTNRQIKTSKQTNKSTNVPCLCQSSTVHGCSLGLTHNRGELRSQHLLICIPNPPAFPLGGQQFKKEEKEKRKKKGQHIDHMCYIIIIIYTHNSQQHVGPTAVITIHCCPPSANDRNFPQPCPVQQMVLTAIPSINLAMVVSINLSFPGIFKERDGERRGVVGKGGREKEREVEE